ncbi:MAG: phosphodiester glycosidase family protein [Propionicimonas sp.]|nr:phosphodiester glycosidase family protein [Propionicimonas sp.]
MSSHESSHRPGRQSGTAGSSDTAGRRPHSSRIVGGLFSLVLTLFTAFVLLDTFVIPHRYATAAAAAPTVAASPASSSTPSTASPTAASFPSTLTPESEPVSYTDATKAITMATFRVDDTDVHVADVVLTDASALRTAFAENTYGRNVTATTSDIATANGAVLAINGAFYGARTTGYVVANGQVYRDQATSADQEDLVISADGSFSIIREGYVTAADLVSQGAVTVLSFGPGLVENGQSIVEAGDEVDKAMASNPRTAIAQIDTLHYLFVVADGRTDQSAGLNLDQLADFLVSLGATTAYNLDGGGSSTMWFSGDIVNVPTTNGNRESERKVSDIVYL